MRIISRQPLKEFSKLHANAKEPLDAWWSDVLGAKWESWTDLKRQYPKVSSVGNDRYVFNINGNEYRLIVSIHFLKKIVYIRFIGTHKDYDKIDASAV